MNDKEKSALALAESAEACITKALDLLTQAQALVPTREAAITITKLEEAQMWLARDTMQRLPSP